MTSTEFVKWVRYLDWRDVEEFRREDFYLAQIAAEIHRANSKRPARVTLEKKLLKFSSKDSPKRLSDHRMDSSKAFWLGLTGARRA